jgi:hypothetical protein
MKDGAGQCRTRTVKGNKGQCRKLKVNAEWSRIMQDKDLVRAVQDSAGKGRSMQDGPG